MMKDRRQSPMRLHASLCEHAAIPVLSAWYGISGSEAKGLLALYRANSPIDLEEFADAMGVQPDSATVLLCRLRARMNEAGDGGWTVITTNRQLDARRFCYQLTSEARADVIEALHIALDEIGALT
jgi:DNA-binding MarR family transcriptional regulator